MRPGSAVSTRRPRPPQSSAPNNAERPGLLGGLPGVRKKRSGKILSSRHPYQLKPKKATIRAEQRLQRVWVDYLRIAAPPGFVYFAVENAFRSKVAGAIMRGLGQQAGVPDMAYVWQGQAVFHELKSEHGRLSPSQTAMHERLREAGAVVATIRSPEAAEAHLRQLGVPLRASLTPHRKRNPR